MRTLFTQLFISGLIYGTLIMDAYARAGGGGGGGGGSGRRGGAGQLIMLPFVLAYLWYRKHKIKSKGNKIDSALLEMGKRESSWEQGRLIKEATTLFTEAQHYWSTQDLSGLKRILHPSLYQTWERDILDQKSRNERNEITGVSINDAIIIDVQNFLDNEKDNFTVYFKVSCSDKTYRNSTHVEDGETDFEECWTFEWESGRWTIVAVTQMKGWSKFVNRGIVNEMRTHDYKKSA